MRCFALVCAFGFALIGGARAGVDFGKFLGNHDMVWDRLPTRWEVAPYCGNGNVGFLFYQAKGSEKNVISLHTGRHDYYDHRDAAGGDQMLWIYRCRLPLGRFDLESKGAITGADLRMNLWDAELTGTVTTTEGSYAVRGLSHSGMDVIYFETDAKDGESVSISWVPEVPYSSVRRTLERGGGPKSPHWDKMRDAPYPLPPEPVLSEEDGMKFCFQALYGHKGETTTGWETIGEEEGKQVLLASVHHSFPEKNSQESVKGSLVSGRKALDNGSFLKSHQEWWHGYYPQSFLTINDAEKEGFYWIQMYKLGSAMRENGPILDLMGPWWHPTFWPMVWGDLNVQLQYWTHLTANRMGVGSSLPNNVDKYAGNLAKNYPPDWKDVAGVATLFPQDMDAELPKGVPDMLCWVLHNYWLHCEFAGDRERMRDGLFPILRKTVNAYLQYLKENPVASDDGKIHIKHSWSPEHPGGRGQDINLTIALLRWSCETLVSIDEEFDLKDPLLPEWKNIVDNLVEFQIDEDGLRIGKDIPFDKPHRHYSHLLAFYPLALITPENKKDAKMLRTTLDHWLDVSFNRQAKDKAMSVTGYTATGAASMYACLGDREQAYEYLDVFIQHRNVSPTTMYAEGNPVIESPLSFATCIHDMLLQSWGGKIRVLHGAPDKWTDVAFENLRTQGAFLVSAKRQKGMTEFVRVESLIGSDLMIRTDIPNPMIFINAKAAPADIVTQGGDGFFGIDLKKGETAILSAKPLEETDLTIAPVPVKEGDRNLFGYSKKTERLQGHQHYSR